jgi:hypothetical protein
MDLSPRSPVSQFVTAAQSRSELRRYTDLTSIIDMLCHKRLVLLNPNLWDDRNDSHFIEGFRERACHGSVLALCLTQAAETYHHWSIYAPRPAGACVIFKKATLKAYLKTQPGIRFGNVTYRTVDQMIAKGHPHVGRLPFIKRQAFHDEKEFRIIRCGPDRLATCDLPIDLALIDRVVLNPWMPRSLWESSRALLRTIEGCESLSIRRSVLTSSDAWKRSAGLDENVAGT